MQTRVLMRQRTQLVWKNRASKRVLFTELGNNVFDYGHKAAADMMRTSWENLVQHVGIKYRQDISNELNKKLK